MKNNTKDIIEALSSGPVRDYINEHANSDISKAILKSKVLFGIPTSKVFEQIATRRKAKEKLPLYYNTAGIIYPPPQNFEQTSSEQTARFKAEIIMQLKTASPFTAVDLTGGFGVDSYFLSKVVDVLNYVEPESSLAELARFNHELLGATNINHHNTTAEEFLKASDPVDLIFIDPSRRTDSKKKVHAFEDSQPDILGLINIIFAKSRLLMVKGSPLLDVQAGISKIPFVRQVYVVSVSNDCKELLFVAEKGFSGTPQIIAVNLKEDETESSFTFTFPEEQEQAVTFSDPLGYLYEPNASIMKAGAFKTVAARFGLSKVDVNTHLYTSSETVANFPGRKFRVLALARPDKSELKEYFPDSRANVTTRNYPLTVEQLKKKTGLKDGGDKFLIGFSGRTKKFLAVAEKF